MDDLKQQQQTPQFYATELSALLKAERAQGVKEGREQMRQEIIHYLFNKEEIDLKNAKTSAGE